MPAMLASVALAQVCGDADDNGSTTVTDGVQVLRAAAALDSSCTVRICDVDDSGAITVTDGVATLSRAARLPAEGFSCGTRFGELVKEIVVGGVTADLQIDEPPMPDVGAPQSVFSIDGPSKVQSGQTASFNVQLTRPVDSLVIAFQEDGSFADGFAEVSVAGNPGSVALQLTAGNALADTLIALKVASRTGGQLGEFQTRPLSIASASLTWSSSTDYSTTSNPTGPWSYGRKLSIEANAFDLMTTRWGDTGWYLGNYGHGGPSFYSGPHLWAKNNTNGFPALRWTSPQDGLYDVNATFTGDDPRGVDNFVYVVVGESLLFSDRVHGGESRTYAGSGLFLADGATIDFALSWGGDVYSEYGWSLVDVTIRAKGQ